MQILANVKNEKKKITIPEPEPEKVFLYNNIGLIFSSKILASLKINCVKLKWENKIDS